MNIREITDLDNIAAF